MKQLAESIKVWIKEKVKESACNGGLVAMSGGVDSSVVAVLTKKALGKHMLGLILPCDSNPEDKKHAMLVAKKFNINTKEIDLTDIYKSFTKILPKAGKTVLGNLKARIRMAVLYYFANKYKYLVVGTSNKTEIMTGYVTKYGDSACDIEPIGNLYKTEVVELAKYLKIPKDIIKKPPSPGLWKGQKDEEELGINYELLDNILRCIESGARKNFSDDVVKKVKLMIKNSEHKRKFPEIFRKNNI